MGKKPSDTVSGLLGDSKVSDLKGQSDTLRVWEQYRDEALMWRAVALFQAPGTLLLVVFCFYLWSTRHTTIQVPPKSEPGIYAVNEIPDVVYTDTATEFLNLIASYQPVIARRQFTEARALLGEPMLTNFNTEMLETELSAIETTKRTQLFFADPTKTTINRTGQQVTVTFVGERMKIVAGRELPLVTSQYSIIMATVPHNKINPYGISIVGANFQDVVK